MDTHLVFLFPIKVFSRCLLGVESAYMCSRLLFYPCYVSVCEYQCLGPVFTVSMCASLVHRYMEICVCQLIIYFRLDYAIWSQPWWLKMQIKSLHVLVDDFSRQILECPICLRVQCNKEKLEDHVRHREDFLDRSIPYGFSRVFVLYKIGSQIDSQSQSMVKGRLANYYGQNQSTP